MPEAPWIKLCEHGIRFTNDITDDGVTSSDREKFKKYFRDPDASVDGP